MRRQRLEVRRLALVDLVIRLLVSLLAIAVGFYGAMLALAALKLDPGTLNRISAYRTIQARLSSITAASITGGDRIVVAVVGLVCLAVFAPLAWRALPRARRTRTRVELPDGNGPGTTRVAPRTLEEVADRWAADDPAITRARTRYGSAHLYVAVQTTATDDLLATLAAVQQRVCDGLRRHGLPQLGIDVTLTAIHQGDTTS